METVPCANTGCPVKSARTKTLSVQTKRDNLECSCYTPGEGEVKVGHTQFQTQLRPCLSSEIQPKRVTVNMVSNMALT